MYSSSDANASKCLRCAAIVLHAFFFLSCTDPLLLSLSLSLHLAQCIHHHHRHPFIIIIVIIIIDAYTCQHFRLLAICLLTQHHGDSWTGAVGFG